MKHLAAVVSLCIFTVGGVSTVSAQWVACSGGSTTCTSASVGIGAGLTAPVTPLEVAGSQTNSSGKFGTYEIQSYSVNNAWLSDNVYYNNGFKFRSAGYATLSYFYNGSFQIRTTNVAGPAGGSANPLQRFFVGNDGTIGLGGNQITGTNTGAAVAISSAGDVGFVGNVSVSGNIAAKYQDFAEWVPSSESLQPGTVVVLDANRTNEVIASRHPYDTTVAGVISANPGIRLGEASPSKVLVATTGRVRVKADTSNGPISIGDLLVTSSESGRAMKSVPIAVAGTSIHRPGTLIGKALEPLEKGEGEILVLLSLQ